MRSCWRNRAQRKMQSRLASSTHSFWKRNSSRHCRNWNVRRGPISTRPTNLKPCDTYRSRFTRQFDEHAEPRMRRIGRRRRRLGERGRAQRGGTANARSERRNAARPGAARDRAGGRGGPSRVAQVHRTGANVFTDAVRGHGRHCAVRTGDAGDLRSSTRRARVADRIPHPAKSISDGTDAPFDEALLADARPAPRNVALWGLGALLLAIVLAAQLTHHFRQDLLRDPTFGPALRRIYVRLRRAARCRLGPRGVRPCANGGPAMPPLWPVR